MKAIKLGYEGKETLLLCQRLKHNDYSVDESRIFTQEMKESVVDFQRKSQLDADGIVGYRIWESLFFTGRPTTERLTEEDLVLVTRLLDVEVTTLKAVQQVETGGKGGFFSPGKPTILFEGHIFWNQLKKRNINPESHVKGNENIPYSKWEKGHYKGDMGEYDRLERARQIDHEAVDASTSRGMFQIMGSSCAACGEKSVGDFVKTTYAGECSQLILSARSIKQSGMPPALQTKDWVEFVRRYNGPAYKESRCNEKLAKAYQKSLQVNYRPETSQWSSNLKRTMD